MERDKLKKDIPRKPSAIFYVEANRAYFYEEGLGSPLALEFEPEIISDLEVLSKKKLESAIQTFINGNKIAPKSVIIVLSTTVTFDKEFPQTSLDIDKRIEEFLELVPFEDYISKQSKFPGKIKVVAANRQLYESVKNAFISLGFVVAGVYPLSFCLETVPQLATNLDLSLIINKSPEIRSFNLLSDELVSASSLKKEKKDNKRLYILLGTFSLLVVILLFVIYRFIILTPKTPKNLPVNTPTLMPIPTVIQPIATPSASLEPEESFSTQSALTQ